MRRAASWLLGLALLGAAVVPLLIGGVDGLRASVALPLHGYLAIVALTFASWALRAAKQGVLMRQLGVVAPAWRVLAISQATEFAFLATPGGIGGFAAGIVYLRREGASYAAATAIAAADQLLDLAFFAAAIPLALLLLVDAPELGSLRAVARGAAFVTCALLAAAWLLRRPLAGWVFGTEARRSWLERLPWLRSRREALRDFLLNLRGQCAALATAPPRALLALSAATALQWITRYGVLWLILRLYGEPVPFALLMLLQGVVLHAAQWTGAPAGVGGADVGLAATLAAFASTPVIAASLLLWRAATLYLCLAGGLASMWVLRQRASGDAAAVEAAAP